MAKITIEVSEDQLALIHLSLVKCSEIFYASERRKECRELADFVVSHKNWLAVA